MSLGQKAPGRELPWAIKKRKRISTLFWFEVNYVELSIIIIEVQLPGEEFECKIEESNIMASDGYS